MARKRFPIPLSGYTILVIDDQDAMRTSVRLLLEHEGHTILTAASGPSGLVLFQTQPVQLVIVDYLMPDMNGPAVIQALRTLNARVSILLQSGETGEYDVQALLQRLDIQGFHDKGDGPDRLLRWVAHLLPRTSTPTPQAQVTPPLQRSWGQGTPLSLLFPSAPVLACTV